MLKIRLSRTGKKYEPHYRIVVTETRSKRDGKLVEQIGHWHPLEDKLVLNKELYKSWLTRGAKPSATVHNLAK